MKLPFIGGRKEAPIQQTGHDVLAVQIGSHEEAVVSFYSESNVPMDRVRTQLAEQFKDGEIVSSIVGRVEDNRNKKSNPGA